MSSILIDKSSTLSQLISPRIDRNKPIYNWHSFKHSYSKGLVDKLIAEFGLKKGSWVMDPFCGGGTTLLACKEAGINATGFDILPFSVFLSNVKTRNYDVKKLLEEKNKFVVNKTISLKIPALTDIPIAKKAFTTDVRRELILIKQRINEIEENDLRDFFNLGLLSILESVSNTSKSGGFLRIVDRKIKPSIVKTLFDLKIVSMIKDVEQFYKSGKVNGFKISAKLGDARKVSTNRKYNAIITSPPYPNRHDYSRIYSLEMLFDFVSDNDDLKKIRYDTLRSHVEARKKYEATNYAKTKLLTQLIEKIKTNGLNNPQVIGMLEGYFEDMYLALKEMYDKLEDKGKIALVVSNVRFSGINIPVDELLSDIGRQVGLKPKAIWIARYRGNSSQQMKEYERVPSRESVVVWEK
ncbi:MAG: DNA methyltransferase [Ignavibacteriaceae bacterium]|jgi:tRNA G10  N-methylase Trm11